MTLIKCQDCGRGISDQAKTCPNCGRPVTQEYYHEKLEICPNCRITIPAGSSVCPKCTNVKGRVPTFILLLVGLVVIVLVAFPGIVSCPKNTTPASNSKHAIADRDAESLEYKMAVINEGYTIQHSHPDVQKARDLINRIKCKVTNTEQEICDMTVVGWQELKYDGYSLGLLELMESVDQSMPDEGNIKWDYAEIIAAWITLYEYNASS